MKVKEMKEMKTTSSLSNLEKIRRNPLSLLNNRSISLRFLYMARLYSQGDKRLA
ncbi:hypothetical protein SAMN05216333_1763 [Nitrosomonas oligotropha]|uniref:Uncharacterized protein n=1 Tax=Nitrosomonas oligotropha TaxID=42354 RepID=A0A1H8VSU6_9PROT|nr:hypothetical protein SAMN05216300_1792 [Nitrosomonas oligotropha]SEP18008.1 hypothetical protein SAMN05216333_1763 [Nitrosomonas oligotropha]